MEPERQCFPPLSDGDWEAQRVNLIDLYMHYTLREVMNIMDKEHHFQAR